MGEASTSAFTFFFVPPVGIAEAFAKKRKKDPRSMWPIEPESSMRNSRCICSVESSWILETRPIGISYTAKISPRPSTFCANFFFVTNLSEHADGERRGLDQIEG